MAPGDYPTVLYVEMSKQSTSRSAISLPNESAYTVGCSAMKGAPKSTEKLAVGSAK
jgi:hypothetical protein